MKLIAVIGGRKASNKQLKIAEEVGRILALNNTILICGGLEGIMEAVSKGAKSANGTTLGILPQDNKRFANDYIDIPIATGMGLARNAIITCAADAIIAIGGEYGTLSEIALGFQMDKPVIGIDTWEIEGIIKAIDAEDAVRKALSLIDSSV